MKYEKPVVIASLCGMVAGIIVAIVFGLLNVNAKNDVFTYKGTIKQLQIENRGLEKQLIEAEGIVRGVASTIEESTNVIESINTGLESGGDLIDASIEILDELLRAISDIEEAVSPQFN